MPVVSSDIVRKRQAGRAPTERAGSEHYGEAFTAAIYELLGQDARAELERAAV